MAREAVTTLFAQEAVLTLIAQLEVPNNEPVIPFPVLTVKLPVMLTLPVNWCVLASKLPNLLDPVTKSTEDVIVCTTIV